MKQAMRDRDKVRLSVLRMVRAAVKNEEIAARRPFSDDEIAGVLRREVKQRQDTMRMIEGADRSDAMAELQAELAVLYGYLPARLDDAAIRAVAAEVIRETGARSRADMGRVMPAVMKRVGAGAEGRTVNRIVQEELAAL